MGRRGVSDGEPVVAPFGSVLAGLLHGLRGFHGSGLIASASPGGDLMKHPTLYRSGKVDGLSIFYREAGPAGAPTLLLLHGFPSSSRMFEALFARLSDR
jgi:hypothetical protein